MRYAMRRSEKSSLSALIWISACSTVSHIPLLPYSIQKLNTIDCQSKDHYPTSIGIPRKRETLALWLQEDRAASRSETWSLKAWSRAETQAAISSSALPDFLRPSRICFQCSVTRWCIGQAQEKKMEAVRAKPPQTVSEQAVRWMHKCRKEHGHKP